MCYFLQWLRDWLQGEHYRRICLIGNKYRDTRPGVGYHNGVVHDVTLKGERGVQAGVTMCEGALKCYDVTKEH